MRRNFNFIKKKGPSPFIITVDGSGTYTIPTDAGLSYNYNVYVVETEQTYSNQTGNCVITFSTTGSIRTLQISGTFPAIKCTNSANDLKLKSVEQWGDIVWGSMKQAFFGARNCVANFLDTANTTNVTDMSGMLWEADSFNASLNGWDTSNVTDMSLMCAGNAVFNGDISDWDVSSVALFNNMFGDSVFNQDISNWNTVSATNMNAMFQNNSSFNQDLSGWCVSNIGSKPASFDDGTTAWVKTNRQPIWGTCP